MAGPENAQRSRLQRRTSRRSGVVFASPGWNDGLSLKGGPAVCTWTSRPALATGFAIFGLVAGATDVGEPARPMVVLNVQNVARLPEHVLRRAAQEVSMVYRAAGVDTSWAEQRGAARAGRIVAIVLVPDEMPANGTDDLFHDDLGFAIRVAQRAYVFCRRIRDVEIRFSRDAGEILGLVIAHEVGHLLLPDEGHSPHGIMRADIDTTSRLRPGFTPREAESIRSSLLRHAD